MLKVVVALLVLGLVIYLVVSLLQRRRGGGGGGGGGGVTPPPLPWRPRRPVAPDDDPTFLRDLDEQVWRQKRDRARNESGGADPPPADAPPADPPAGDSSPTHHDESEPRDQPN